MSEAVPSAGGGDAELRAAFGMQTRTVVDISEENVRLADRVRAIEAERNRLRTSVEAATTMAEAQAEKAGALNGRTAELAQTIAHLELAAREREIEGVRAEGELRAAQDALGVQQQESEAVLKETNAEREAWVRRSDFAKHESTADVQKVAARCGALQVELGQRQAELTRAAEEILLLQAGREADALAVAQLREERAAVDEALAAVGAEKGAAEESAKRLEEDVAWQRIEHVRGEERHAKERAAWGEARKALEAESTAGRDEGRAARGREHDATRRAEDAERALADSKHVCEELRETTTRHMDEEESRRAELQARYDAQAAELSAAQTEAAALRNRLAKAEARGTEAAAEAATRAQTADADVARLQQQVHEQGEIVELAMQQVQVVRDLQEQRTSLARGIDKLETERRLQCTTQEDLSVQLRVGMQSLAQTQDALQTRTATLGGVQARCNDFMVKNASLTEERARLVGDVAHAAAQARALTSQLSSQQATASQLAA